jgi:regulator of RNase E activity RraA
MEIYKPVRPAKKLIEGFRGLATSTTGNVLDDMKISGVIQNIKPVCPGFRFAGGPLTVKIDGILVRPGDIVVGDATGIVCVPIEVAEEVMNLATRFDEQDKQAIAEIRQGMGFTEALQKYAKI